MKTRKIVMKSISSGPDGVMHPNSTYPVSEAKAKALVDGGFAEYETAMVAKHVVKTPEEAKRLAEGEAPANKKDKDSEPEGPANTTGQNWGTQE